MGKRRWEVCVEGDRGIASRVARRYPGRLWVREQSFSSPTLSLVVEDRTWELFGTVLVDGRYTTCVLARGGIDDNGMVTID